MMWLGFFFTLERPSDGLEVFFHKGRTLACQSPPGDSDDIKRAGCETRGGLRAPRTFILPGLAKPEKSSYQMRFLLEASEYYLLRFEGMKLKRDWGAGATYCVIFLHKLKGRVDDKQPTEATARQE